MKKILLSLLAAGTVLCGVHAAEAAAWFEISMTLPNGSPSRVGDPVAISYLLKADSVFNATRGQAREIESLFGAHCPVNTSAPENGDYTIQISLFPPITASLSCGTAVHFLTADDLVAGSITETVSMPGQIGGEAIGSATLAIEAAEPPPTTVACVVPAGQSSKFVFRYRSGVLPC